MQDVREADWSPDGSQLAVIHVVKGKDRLEYPAGHMLVEWSGGYLSDPRVSPQGDRIAYFEHSGPFLDDRGVVAIVDLNGKITRLSDTFWGSRDWPGRRMDDGYCSRPLLGACSSRCTR